MADSWDSATKSAMKTLGPKGKIPKIPGTIPKGLDAIAKTYGEFNKVRQDLKVKLVALQTVASAYKNVVSQFQDEIDEDDLGLNRKDKDEAKKIADAQKALSGWLQQQMDSCDDDVKNFKELDKHLMNVINYKK